MSSIAGVMENTTAYRLWQAPFARAKLEPLYRHADPSSARRVLDVGCGPGTNSRIFATADYVGVDVNPGYVEYARSRFRGRFEIADAVEALPRAVGGYDLVLINSVLHHIADAGVLSLLRNVKGVLAEGGVVHIMDLVLPARRSVARTLARMDRGDHPRPLERWGELLGREMAFDVVEPFTLSALGVSLWEMVYLKSRAA
jgi:SAM-dependent methyltransferase